MVKWCDKMGKQKVTTEIQENPLTFNIAKWYGYVFAVVYVLYGGVKIVLGALDHNYDDMAQPLLFLLLGVILITPAFAFRDLRRWGWYGLVGINGLVVLLSLFMITHFESWVLIVFSGIALAALFAPATKERFF